MTKPFIFQLIDGHFVSQPAERKTTIPAPEKKTHISLRRQDMIALITEKLESTFCFSDTCSGIAKQIAYDRNKKLPLDIPASQMFHPDIAAAQRELERFLTGKHISLLYMKYLKNVLYITDSDIVDNHRIQNMKRKHDRDNARDIKYFYRCIPYLMKHREQIISCREYYNVMPDGFGCSFAYTDRSAPVTLGELLCHYAAGTMTEQCPNCGGTSYVYFACGSPLSGANIYHAACPKCQKYIRARAPTVWKFFKPLMEFDPLFKYEPSPYTVRKLVWRLRREKASESAINMEKQ